MAIDGIQARLQALRPSWLAGENIALRLVLDNQLERALSLYDPRVHDNARPVFVAELPAGVTTVVDNRGNPVTLDDAGLPLGLPRDMVVAEIAAGESLTAIIDPGRVLPITDGGSYRIHLLLETDAGPLVTETAEFQVEAFRPLSVELGSWTPPPELGRSVMMASALHQGSEGLSLVSGSFEAEASHPDRLPASALRARLQLEEPAGRPVAQAAVHSYRDDFCNAHAWGGGACVFILASTEDAPAQVDVGGPLQQVIAPSLLLPDRTLELFAIVGDVDHELLAIRGEAFFKRSSAAPSVVARVALPFRAVQAVAALRLQTSDGPQRGVAVLAEDGRSAVFGFDGQAFSTPALFAAVGEEALPILSESPPALVFSDQGFRLAFLGWAADAEGEGGTLELVQIEQPGSLDDGEAATPSIRAEQLRLPAAARAGRLVFAEPEQPPFWAVWSGDGRVFGPGPRVLLEGLAEDAAPGLLFHHGSPRILISDPWQGLRLETVEM